MTSYFYKKKSAFYLSVIAFRAILDFLYIYFISDIYDQSYLKFSLNVEYFSYGVSWVPYLAMLPLLKHRLKNISEYFVLSATLGLIGPMSSMYGLDFQRSFYPLLVTWAAIFSIGFFCNIRAGKPTKMLYFSKSREIFLVMSIILVLLDVAWFILSGAVRNINFDFTAVYDFRGMNSEIADVGIISYLNIWSYKVFNIFLICYFIWKKKWPLVVFFVLVQIFFFGVTSHKAVIFFPLLIFSIWFYFRKNDLAIALPWIFSATVLVGYIAFEFFDNQYAASLLVRRIFFVPAANTYAYFDFFEYTPYIFWSDSVLSAFLQYEHQLPVSYLVGQSILSEELGANNGFVSRGFANAGAFGVVFYVVVIIWFLKMLDGLSKSGVPFWVSLSLTAIPLRTLIFSSDLFTTLLSHGLLWAILLLLALRQNSNYYGTQQRNGAG